MQSKEGVKGSFWLTEHDMRKGTILKLDKTSKAILTVLRHLGRINEVRILLEFSADYACS